MILKRKLKSAAKKQVKAALHYALSQVRKPKQAEPEQDTPRRRSKLLRWFLALHLVRKLTDHRLSPLQKLRELFDAIASILDVLILLVLFAHLVEDLKQRRARK